ncbi:mCG1050932 [Mus musculus]|nr:mCG1050932 [Mus musculus]
MSENLQSSPFFGTESTLHPSLPLLSNSKQPAGTVCNFSRVSTPDVSSAWLLPSASSTSLQPLMVVQMEMSLGLPPSGQTHYQLQSPELCNTCVQVSQIRPPAVNGDKALTAPIHSPSQFLALPPAPSLEQPENKTMPEIKEGTKENQDTPVLTLEHPDLQQPLHCTDTESLRQKPDSDNAHLGCICMGPKELVGLENEIGSSFDFKDITRFGADIQLPQLLNTLTDIDQDQSCENWRVTSGLFDQVRENKHKSFELLEGAPQAKFQHWDLVEGEGAVGVAGASDRAIDNMAKHPEGKAPKGPPSKNRRARKQEQERPSGPENKSKKTQELKQSRNRVKAEKEPSIPKTKRKRNPPELSQNSFKKPRTNLAMHMLESVQVFHPLGKKSEKKTGISSFRGLRTFTSNKDSGPGSVTTTVLNMPCESQGPPKSPGKVQSAESSVGKDCLSPSQYELPPAGKVKLVPLPFPTLDKPQSRPASRKPLSLALRRPTAVYPVQHHSHSVQPTTLRPAQPPPASSSLIASAKPAPPISSSATGPNVTNPNQSSAVPQLATSRPVPYRASSHTSFQRELVSAARNKVPSPPRPVPYRASSNTSFQRELVSAARNKVPSPPKPQTQYLLHDFSRQPIPWKKVDILGPVVSQPITKEQRPEREAMKRRSQQERENAVKNPSTGKLQIFLQRERDMEISQYYGYAM